MIEFMDIARALADENRVRVLLALRERELCVCQIVEMLGLAPSTVSKHISILRQARLLESRKDGRWIYYRLSGKDAPEAARTAIEWVSKCLENEPRIAEDTKRVDAICSCFTTAEER